MGGVAAGVGASRRRTPAPAAATPPPSPLGAAAGHTGGQPPGELVLLAVDGGEAPYRRAGRRGRPKPPPWKSRRRPT